MLTSSLLLVLDLRSTQAMPLQELSRTLAPLRRPATRIRLELRFIAGISGDFWGRTPWRWIRLGTPCRYEETYWCYWNFGIQNYWSRHQSFSRSCPALWISIAWKWKGLGGPIRCCRDGANWMIPWSIVLWGLLQFGLFARSSGMKPVEMTSCHWELQLWKIMWIKLNMNFMWNPHTWIYMDLLW